MRAAAVIIIAVIAGFSTVVTSFTVDCVFGTYTYTGIGNVYRCHIRNIPESSNHTVTNVIGTHATGKTNEDVQMVNIPGNYRLSFIPRGFTNFFSNLIGINLSETTFDTLNGDELDEFGEKLKFFALQYSPLTTISSHLFDFTPNIAYLFFGTNNLKSVGRDLFTAVNVTQLGNLQFEYNPCINRNANNQTGIVALISELQVSCPFYDLSTTTPTTTTTTPTTTTTEPMATTPAVPACFDGQIEDFVCEINDNIGVVQSDLTSTRDDLQGQLDDTHEMLEGVLGLVREEQSFVREELALVKEELASKDQMIVELKTNFDAMKDELQWLRDELLRLTTNPCACK
jgi:hypothetical protein